MTWNVGGHFLGGERRASRHGTQENLLGDYRGTVEWGFTGWAIVDLLVRSKPLVRETSPFTDKTCSGFIRWRQARA